MSLGLHLLGISPPSLLPPLPLSLPPFSSGISTLFLSSSLSPCSRTLLELVGQLHVRVGGDLLDELWRKGGVKRHILKLSPHFLSLLCEVLTSFFTSATVKAFFSPAWVVPAAII